MEKNDDALAKPFNRKKLKAKNQGRTWSLFFFLYGLFGKVCSFFPKGGETWIERHPFLLENFMSFISSEIQDDILSPAILWHLLFWHLFVFGRSWEKGGAGSSSSTEAAGLWSIKVTCHQGRIIRLRQIDGIWWDFIGFHRTWWDLMEWWDFFTEMCIEDGLDFFSQDLPQAQRQKRQGPAPERISRNITDPFWKDRGVVQMILSWHGM